MLCSLHTLSHLKGVGHHGHITPLVCQGTLANRQQQIFIPVIRHFKFSAVMLAVFHHNHGVIVTDSALQKSLGGIGVRGNHDLGAGEIRYDGIQVLGVLRRSCTAGANRGADNHGARLLSPGHIADLCHLVDNLIHCHQHKVREHNLNNRPHTGKRHAHAHPDDARLADG